MKNRNMPADPMFNEGGVMTINNNVGIVGLTKLETAAIAFMAAFMSDINSPLDGEKRISKLAVNFANTLFDELEKE